MWQENPKELFQGKPMQSGRDWKPNPHYSALGGIQTEGPRGWKKHLHQPDRF